VASQVRTDVGNVGEHVEKVALFGVDDALHFGQLVVPKALFGETLQ
jgi:hypothetical protein